MAAVLVLGGSGMLGHELWRTCAERFDAYATVRSDELERARGRGAGPRDRIVTGVRAEEPRTIARALDETRPDAVVNCIGIVKQAVDDPEPAIRVNALFPHAAGRRVPRARRPPDPRLHRLRVLRAKRAATRRATSPTRWTPTGARSSWASRRRPGALTIRTSMIGRELATSHGLARVVPGPGSGGSVRGFTARRVQRTDDTSALARDRRRHRAPRGARGAVAPRAPSRSRSTSCCCSCATPSSSTSRSSRTTRS